MLSIMLSTFGKWSNKEILIASKSTALHAFEALQDVVITVTVLAYDMLSFCVIISSTLFVVPTSVCIMACAASTGTVHPVPVKDARESPLRVASEPETLKADMVSINRPWGKLMVGFLIAKLDQMVQQALAGLERDDCELFASSEYSATRPCNQGRRLQVFFDFVEDCMLQTMMLHLSSHAVFFLFPHVLPAESLQKQGSAYPGSSAIPGAPEVSSFAGGSAGSWDLYADLLRDFLLFQFSLMTLCPEVVLKQCSLNCTEHCIPRTHLWAALALVLLKLWRVCSKKQMQIQRLAACLCKKGLDRYETSMLGNNVPTILINFAASDLQKA